MNFLPENLEQYCEAHSDPEPPILKEIRRQTHLKTLYPQMLCSALQGRFLAWLSRLVRPRNVLEVGTFTGYSALCLAEGLQEGGHVYTLEAQPEYEDLIRTHLEWSGIGQKIKLIMGPAQDTLRALPCKVFDLIYLDADKENYPKYYPILKEMLSRGGLLLVDNTLWSGKVADSAHADPETEGIRQLNELLTSDPDFEKILLPVRDGLTLARRKVP
ncbi:MAG: class I SAM-dependent methyltransferase [Flavobacteriales bacterium]|nr:class I SAM-dependent methyltransferase [Flavobacteriales bacterium]MCX7768544.1 class I SAM-dependent methyltransferase [Flavobacteriales bacterium]MDW8409487.1 class I SAM-dependent methyltransferase [Flavobacteriales bacterium]